MTTPTVVRGNKESDIMLFALSTCGMCRHVKRLLGELGMQYRYLDVDLLDPEEKEIAKNEMRKWNSRCPFPMLVIDGSTCVVGDEPEEIRSALGV